MKTTLLTIALAVAALPTMFAKQVPPPANSTTAAKPAVTSKKTKKHVKKVAPKTTGTPAATSIPAAPAPVKK